MHRIIATIPTYNESENITDLINDLLDLKLPGLEVLVIDDDSPDGTSNLVDSCARKREGVHLLTRKTERGRGSAGIAGFKKALEMGADFVVEMDADYSHHPRFLPGLVDVLVKGEADIAIGSRFVPGGEDMHRPFVRQLISELARRYIRVVLGLNHIEDVTSGYRGFSAAVLRAVELDTLRSTGPSIVSELLFRSHRKGFKVAERPIEFRDRERGESTLTLGILVENLMFMPRLRLRGW